MSIIALPSKKSPSTAAIRTLLQLLKHQASLVRDEGEQLLVREAGLLRDRSDRLAAAIRESADVRLEQAEHGLNLGSEVVPEIERRSADELAHDLEQAGPGHRGRQLAAEPLVEVDRVREEIESVGVAFPDEGRGEVEGLFGVRVRARHCQRSTRSRSLATQRCSILGASISQAGCG